MKRILITGSKGFIGKRLLDSLFFNDSIELKGIDDEYFYNDDWIKELNRILNSFKPNVVFHVGACSDTLETNSNYMFIRNYESTKIISEWCYENDSIMIYSSSAANYGVNNLYPSNLYGWSKYTAEKIVSFNNGISLRYFNVYGPGEEHKGKMSSVAYQMYMKHKNNEQIKLFPGKPSRDFVYIDDVIHANIYAWENYKELLEERNDEYYEVGSGESRTFEDVLNNLNIPFDYVDEKNVPEGYQFYTISKSDKWLPGWKPKFNIEKGLDDYKKYLDI